VTNVLKKTTRMRGMERDISATEIGSARFKLDKGMSFLFTKY